MFRQGSLLFLWDIASSQQRAEQSVAHDGHDEGGEQDAQQDGGYDAPGAHLQETGDDRAGPGSGAGEGDAYEERQSPEAVFLDACLMPIYPPPEPERESPRQGKALQQRHDPLDEEQHEGDREQISEDADQQRAGIGESKQGGSEQTAPKLEYREQVNQEYDALSGKNSTEMPGKKRNKSFHIFSFL